MHCPGRGMLSTLMIIRFHHQQLNSGGRRRFLLEGGIKDGEEVQGKPEKTEFEELTESDTTRRVARRV